MWMRPAQAVERPAAPGGELAPIAGASPETDVMEAGAERRHLELVFVGVVFSAAAIVFGIVPSPLFHFAAHAGHAFAGLF
jgi:hypothetical protein